MKKHELMDKLEDLQIEAWEENTGSNEADLDYREKVYSLIEGLLKNNGVLIDVNKRFDWAVFIAGFCIGIILMAILIKSVC
jgi:hypothetical protein